MYRFLRRAAVCCVFIPAMLQAQTLTFDDVSTNGSGVNNNFSAYSGYTFEGFNVVTSNSLGSGMNAVSGIKFALGRSTPDADGAIFSSIYRTGDAFNFTSAYLSFRQFDLVDPLGTPVGINVLGYRAGFDSPVFSQFVVLTGAAQLFQFEFANIEEVVFETEALTAGGRFTALALDNAQLAVVPEPTTVVLMSIGMAGILAVVRRRARRS